jgi:hypothetical protein
MKNKKLGILGDVALRIARAEKIKQEIANAENMED